MVSIPKISIPKYSQIKQNIATTKKYYIQSAKNGWQEGKHIAQINHYGKPRTLYIKTKKSIANTVGKVEELPKVLTVIGACSPIPGGFVIGYGVGKAIELIAKGIKKIKK